MNNYCVYKHTAPCGKVYIGITQQQPQKRWKNGLGYSDNPYFKNAIEKYGWDNIKHEILADSLSKEEAENLEIYYIQAYQSTNRNNGYNIAKGGNVVEPSEESKEKTSISMTRFWANPSNKEKMVKAMSGVRKSKLARENISKAQKMRFEREEERTKISERQIGKTRTETAKKKTSESLKKFYSDPKNKEAFNKAHEGVNRQYHAKQVICVETGELFTAVVDAENKYGIDHRNIIATCKGKRKKAGGFHWEYANRGDEDGVV